MFGLQTKVQTRERALEYATRNDFAAIFNDDMSALHTLALLLTADYAKAEECFVAGLEDSFQGNPVFRQWARAWSKRVIIRNAIKMMRPVPGQANPAQAASSAAGASAERDAWMSVIWELPAFERFVFVISVLEGHSVSDCASLLGCTLTELSQGRSHALTQIARARGVAVASPAHNPASLRLIARFELA